jgi:heat-inducible transcriptional repressor
MHNITTRQREILNAIVESYIATGEPVGSSTLVRNGSFGTLSSATIRSEMAGLADAGMLDQPHTSAGRIPSAEAFRLYVADLATRGSEPRTSRLPALSQAEVAEQIDPGFAGVAGARALLERTSHVLATVSSGVGVALSATGTIDHLEHVHFSRLAERRVLAVLVTRSGMVRDRVLVLEHDLSSRELESAANFLNVQFRGWNLERVRADLARRLENERSEYQRLLNSADNLWSRTVPEGGQSLFVEGVSNLVTSAAEDRPRLREMLSALEAKERMIELLNAYVDARQESVRVIFDLEAQAPEMAGLVLIAAPARVGGETIGAVGVLGPQRMHYENTMNAVSYIAALFERMATHRT